MGSDFNKNMPFVSVIMPCRDEVVCIESALNSVFSNNYPKNRMEVIVVDGESTDGTKIILERMAAHNHIMTILTNPKRIAPTAMNIGIKAAQGNIIIRMDAHTHYPVDYIDKCVEYLNKTDAWCVGGPFYTTPLYPTPIARTIAYVLSSPFGVATSYFRTQRKPMFVETVPYGAFRKEVFDKAGLYDERFVRGQDYELCRRIIKMGGKIFMTPEIKNMYHPSQTMAAFLKKAYFTGLCTTTNLALQPYTFHWRHFVPLLFFLYVSLAAMAGIFSSFFAAGVLITAFIPLFIYFAAACFFSLNFCWRQKINQVFAWAMPPVFFLYHFSYGCGSFKGFVTLAMRRIITISTNILALGRRKNRC